MVTIGIPEGPSPEVEQRLPLDCRRPGVAHHGRPDQRPLWPQLEAVCFAGRLIFSPPTFYSSGFA